MSEQLNQLIRQTTELPSMPEVAFEVMRVADLADSSAITVAATLARDPSLSVRILRLANSAFYGMSREVTSISDAVVVLGMRTVKSLSLVAASFPWLHKALDGKGINPTLLWNHSLTTAYMVRGMASRKGMQDAELPFCIALLHDIGTVVFAVWKENAFSNLVTRAEDEQRPLDAIERETYGFDHAEVGAELCDVWNLPKVYGSAIRYHHQPSLPETPDQLADLIHVADFMVRERGINEGAFGQIYQRDLGAFERVGFSDEVLNELLDSAISQCDDLQGSERKAA
jgi:putative nucleotidyltransferase with HDIG domain